MTEVAEQGRWGGQGDRLFTLTALPCGTVSPPVLVSGSLVTFGVFALLMKGSQRGVEPEAVLPLGWWSPREAWEEGSGGCSFQFLVHLVSNGPPGYR